MDILIFIHLKQICLSFQMMLLLINFNILTNKKTLSVRFTYKYYQSSPLVFKNVTVSNEWEITCFHLFCVKYSSNFWWYVSRNFKHTKYLASKFYPCVISGLSRWIVVKFTNCPEFDLAARFMWSGKKNKMWFTPLWRWI